MATAPTPSEIFSRAAEEGQRRLDQPLLELVSTGFIAGFTIIFGMVALGVAHAMVEPHFEGIARIAGALAFASGFVFLIVGRSELFAENFFDPIATGFEHRESGIMFRILRLWGITLVLNLVGGSLFALVVSVEGVLPDGAGSALRSVADEIAGRGTGAGMAAAVVGGALVALLSYLLQAVNSDGGRITVAFFVGFLLALGPFDHVVVSVLHLFLGILFGASISLEAVAAIFLIATAGNLIGGIGLVTLSHAAQAKGAPDSEER